LCPIRNSRQKDPTKAQIELLCDEIPDYHPLVAPLGRRLRLN
jgi:hypothetical protein